ncbi:unnamed protein product [Nyctereutes procyonoides]|uniref:COX assembly mitochondrial protein n=1 Tax=Nyctereutes procyonoides TaxID=34880 RepID=A0A811Z057_NYCPR|nr:unnamed protein product [Nyctereutes procyonoides]
MHPDLSPHLHTEECNILTNFILKLFGHCNDLDEEIRKYLKNEYLEKRTKSKEHGNVMQKRHFNPAKETEK